MKKVVLIPDSFKGTLSSAQICEIIGGKVAEHFPGCQVVSIPVADGGEGTVETLVSGLGGELIQVNVTGPLGEPVQAAYGWLPQQQTAVFEMAQASGLEAGELVHVIADAHIYDRHVPLVRQLLERQGRPAPAFVMDPEVTDFYRFTRDSFRLEGYDPLPFDEKIPVAI